MVTLPRPALAFLVVTLPIAVGAAHAQSTPAAPATPPAKARWVPPVKGPAEIGYLKPQTKVVGKEVVTKVKIMNMSGGQIALLRVDEYWYDKAGNMLPGDTQRWKKPFMPGEVIELEFRTPHNPKFFQNTYQFKHAHGPCKPKLMRTLEQKQPAGTKRPAP
jgi:hypothetical protein